MKKISKFLVLVLMFTTFVLSLTACSSDPTKDAEAAVTKTFDELKALNDTTFEEYFGENGLDSFGLTEDNQEEFKKFIKAIVDNLSYTIVSSEKVDDNNVIVKVDVTAIKMENVMNKFIENSFAFAMTEEAQNLSEEEIAKKSMELLIEAISQPDLETITTTVDINVTKTDNVWDFQVDDKLLDAIYGGMFSIGM